MVLGARDGAGPRHPGPLHRRGGRRRAGDEGRRSQPSRPPRGRGLDLHGQLLGRAAFRSAPGIRAARSGDRLARPPAPAGLGVRPAEPAPLVRAPCPLDAGRRQRLGGRRAADPPGRPARDLPRLLHGAAARRALSPIGRAACVPAAQAGLGGRAGGAFAGRPGDGRTGSDQLPPLDGRLGGVVPGRHACLPAGPGADASVRVALRQQEEDAVLGAVLAVAVLLQRQEGLLGLGLLADRELPALVPQVPEHPLRVLAQRPLPLVEEVVAQAAEEVGEDLRVVDLPVGVLEPVRADRRDQAAAELAAILGARHHDRLRLRHHLLVRPLHVAGVRVAQPLAARPRQHVQDVALEHGPVLLLGDQSHGLAHFLVEDVEVLALRHAHELLVIVVAVHHLLLEELVDALVADQRLQLLQHRLGREALVRRVLGGVADRRLQLPRARPGAAFVVRVVVGLLPEILEVLPQLPRLLRGEAVGSAALAVEARLLQRGEMVGQLAKARLYGEGRAPDRLSSQQARELRKHLQDFWKESDSYPNYEGRTGASARELKTAIGNAAQNTAYKCLTPQAVLEELESLIRDKSVYEFLQQEVVDGYHDHEEFVRVAEGEYLDVLDEEVRQAMGLVSEKQYRTMFERYVLHVLAWTRGERLRNPHTGDMERPDEEMMAQTESIVMSGSEDRREFRRGLISAVGAHRLEHPDGEIDYSQIFPDLFRRLRDHFFDERKRTLRKNAERVLRHLGDERGQLAVREQTQAQETLLALEKYGYCEHCAKDGILLLLAKRYTD